MAIVVSTASEKTKLWMDYKYDCVAILHTRRVFSEVNHSHLAARILVTS